MKTVFTFIATMAFAFALPVAAFAAETAEGAKKPAERAAAAPEKVAGEIRAIPMYVRVDLIDPSARTFTLKRKDGVEVKHIVPPEAEVKQGLAAAKFEDIKIGDYVSGMRRKVSETQYTVVKITKFGPPAKKP